MTTFSIGMRVTKSAAINGYKNVFSVSKQSVRYVCMCVLLQHVPLAVVSMQISVKAVNPAGGL